MLAFSKGVSRVLIDDLGRIMGLCISSGNNPMFSSLPCAHNTPCSSDAGISFLSTVYKLIVCQLHLNNHSLDSLNSSVKWCLFFTFNLVLLVNRRMLAKVFLALANVKQDFIKYSKIGLPFDSLM